jgi:hypothetical protein
MTNFVFDPKNWTLQSINVLNIENNYYKYSKYLINVVCLIKILI